MSSQYALSVRHQLAENQHLYGALKPLGAQQPQIQMWILLTPRVEQYHSNKILSPCFHQSASCARLQQEVLFSAQTSRDRVVCASINQRTKQSGVISISKEGRVKTDKAEILNLPIIQSGSSPYLFTRRALQTHRCVTTEGRISLRPQETKSRRGRFVFTLQTKTFTKYSRIFGQEVQPSRSSQPTMPSIHHEVLTIYPAGHPSRSTHVLLLLYVCCCRNIHHEIHTNVVCPSITKYSTLPCSQMSIHHEVLTCCCCRCQNIHHEVLTWRYSDVGYWWFKLPFAVQFTQSPRTT